ncbi:MAG: DUF4160 domain-containing protein [Caldilineaceae bacterium]|nr:DUF4160 domain-containing protein [Caldilineaceae bacterium]
MPTTLILGPYRFSFFSGDCAEPRHTHVWRDDCEAKFWLDPVVLAYNKGFRRKEIRQIERMVRDNSDLLRSKWDEHCAG